MPISVSCKCGKKFKAPEKLAGKKVKCPACSAPLQIPDVAVQPQAKASPAKSIKVACSCGKNLMVKAELEGKAIRCPNCGTAVKVTPAKGAVAPAKRQAAAPPPDVMGNMLDEVDLGASASGHRCPECRNDLEPGDVFCVKCGYNLETRRKLATKTTRKRDSLGRLAGPVSDRAKKGKKKKKSMGTSDLGSDLQVILGTLGLIFLPTMVLWFIQPLYAAVWFAITNSVAGLVAYVYVVVIAFREDGVLSGLFSLICGIYWLVYTFMHLENTKVAAIIWAITFVGGFALNSMMEGIIRAQ